MGSYDSKNLPDSGIHIISNEENYENLLDSVGPGREHILVLVVGFCCSLQALTL